MIVQIAAAGVNFVDILYVRKGSYSVLYLWHLLCFFPPKSLRARMLRGSFRKLNVCFSLMQKVNNYIWLVFLAVEFLILTSIKADFTISSLLSFSL